MAAATAATALPGATTDAQAAAELEDPTATRNHLVMAAAPAQVSGSMMGGESDDDDDDDDDDYDDDEEDCASGSAERQTTSDGATGGMSSLEAAMSAAVQETLTSSAEEQMRAELARQQRAAELQMRMQATAPSSQAHVNATAMPDEFGIMYQHVPRAVRLTPEQEAQEREAQGLTSTPSSSLRAQQQRKQQDQQEDQAQPQEENATGASTNGVDSDDDEFDFEAPRELPPAAPMPSAADVVAATALQPQQEATLPATETQSEAVKSATTTEAQAEAEAEAEFHPESNQTETDQPPVQGEDEPKLDVYGSARQALRDLHQVYSTGMGTAAARVLIEQIESEQQQAIDTFGGGASDGQVQDGSGPTNKRPQPDGTADATNASSTSATSTLPEVPSDTSTKSAKRGSLLVSDMVIAEEDEEAEEEEEEQESLAQKQRQQEQLAAERDWAAVAEVVPADVTTPVSGVANSAAAQPPQPPPAAASSSSGVGWRDAGAGATTANADVESSAAGSPLLTYAELEAYFLADNFDFSAIEGSVYVTEEEAEEAAAQAQAQATGASADSGSAAAASSGNSTRKRRSLLGSLTRKSLRFDGHEAQLRLPFQIAQIEYNPGASDGMHLRALQTIFRTLTGQSRDPAPTGPHWDAIGFQGRDPCTDVNRSMRMFAIMQVLAFLESQPEFAADLHRISVQEGAQGWPFMCVSIGFTKHAMQALRRGDLYAECNKKQAVMPVLHDYHQALFYDFHSKIVAEPTVHHARHLMHVAAESERNPKKVLSRYHSFLKNREKAAAQARQRREQDLRTMERAQARTQGPQATGRAAADAPVAGGSGEVFTYWDEERVGDAEGNS